MGRVDNPQITNFFALYANIGMRLFDSGAPNPNGFVSRLTAVNVGLDGVNIGLQVEDANAMATFTNTYFNTNTRGIWVKAGATGTTPSLLTFNGLDLAGSAREAIRAEVACNIQMSNLLIRNWNFDNSSYPAIYAASGAVVSGVNVEADPANAHGAAVFATAGSGRVNLVYNGSTGLQARSNGVPWTMVSEFPCGHSERDKHPSVWRWPLRVRRPDWRRAYARGLRLQ